MNDYLLQQILEQLQKISAQLTAIQANLDWGPRVRHRHLAAGVRANSRRRKRGDARARRPARQAVIDDQDTSRSVFGARCPTPRAKFLL